MATINDNITQLEQTNAAMREVIGLCYAPIADNEGMVDYPEKLARLAVDEASEQVIATAARTTAGGVAIKDTIAVVDKVYGNTLVWNQGIQKTSVQSSAGRTNPIYDNETGITTANLSNGTGTYVGVLYLYDFKVDSYYLVRASLKKQDSSASNIGYVAEQGASKIYNSVTATDGVWETIASIHKCAYSASRINFYCGSARDGMLYIKDTMLIDLTRMFGSGQEPTTLDDFCLKIFGKASASVTDAEWEAVSAYCEPTLLSSKPKKVVSKEKSLWWNQLLNTTATSNENRGINVVKNANGSYTFSGTTTAGYNYVFTSSTTSISFYKAHKYLFGYCNTNRDCSSSVNLYLRDYTNSRSIAEVNLGGTIKCVISTNPYNGNGTAYVNYGTSGGKINCTIIPLVIDLTAMFGEGNEPTTINEFTQRIFGKDSDAVTDEEWASISAYNEGEELNYKLGTPFVSEITIDPTAIVDEEGEQVFPNGLLSAGTAKDYIDIERGVAVKCVESVDLGSLSWSNTSLENRYFCTLPSDAELYMQGDYRYAIAKYTKSVSIPTTDKCISLNNNKYAYILDSSYSTKEDFKTAMNGVVLYYKLATPIEYPLPKRKCFYRVSNGGTEKITADGMTTPMIADIAYREAVTASEAVAMLAEASGIN